VLLIGALEGYYALCIKTRAPRCSYLFIFSFRTQSR